MPSFPDPGLLEGAGVALRLGAERDIPETLIAFQDDPQLHLRLGIARPPSGAELGRRSEGADAERAAGDAVELAVVAPGDDLCLGQVNVHRVDWEHQRAELGIWLHPRARGRGMGAGALALTAGWLLRDCGIQRVEAFTETDNEPMLAAARKAGMHLEGVLRGYTLEHGRRVDNVVLSLIVADLES